MRINKEINMKVFHDNHKNKFLKELEDELQILLKVPIDKEGLKHIKQLNKKQKYVDEKYHEAHAFQETLQYMLNRDLMILLRRKEAIGILKYKKQRINQAIKEIQHEIYNNRKQTDDHNREKFEIGAQFKSYIQNIE